MAAIRLAGVSSAPREDGFAIRGVDLEVADASICALVGPSGSGKTTLLRLVAGLDPVAAGRVYLADDDITDWPPGKRNVAWLSQEHPLYPHLDVEHNIGFALRLKRMLREDITERVHAEARVTGVERLLHRRPSTLSAGEQQAAGLARATARMPGVYLFDEPLARIDPQERTRLRAELAQYLGALAATSIVGTNDQTEAFALGDQIAVLRNGALAQAGPPAELFARPADAFVAAFLGSPGMNVAPGRFEAGTRSAWVRFDGDAVELHGCPPHLRRALDGRAVLVGVRPEHVRLAPAGTGLPAQVERVEVLGHATVVYARLRHGTRLTARCRPGQRARRGEAVGLRVDSSRLHLFDPLTERALWQTTP